MKRNRVTRAAARRVPRRKNIVVDEDDSEEDSDEFEGRDDEDDEEEEDEDDEEEEEEEQEEEEEEEEEEEAYNEEEGLELAQKRRQPIRKQPPRGQQSRDPKRDQARDEEDDEEDDEEEKEENNKRQEEEEEETIKQEESKNAKKPAMSKDDELLQVPEEEMKEPTMGEGEEQEKAQGEDEDDEDDEPMTFGRKRKKNVIISPHKASSEEEMPDPDDDKWPQVKEPGEKQEQETAEEDDDEEQEETQSPFKKRKTMSDTHKKTRPFNRSGITSNTSTPTKQQQRERDQKAQEDKKTLSSSSSEAMNQEGDDKDPELDRMKRARAAGFSIGALVDEMPDENEDDTGDNTEEDVESPPFADLPARLEAANTEQQLLKVLTDVFGGLVKDQQSPSRLICVAMLRFARTNTDRFNRPVILKYLLRLLRSKHYLTMRDQLVVSDSKKAATREYPTLSLPVLIANLLVHIMKNMRSWPIDSIKVFLDDSLYSRVWVDHELCRLFVQNVKTILHAHESNVDPKELEELINPSARAEELPLVSQRFHGEQVAGNMKDLVVNHLRMRLGEVEKERGGALGTGGGGGGSSNVRNMIMTLNDFALIPQARSLAVDNIETWIQNASLKAAAKDLLAKIVSLCDAQDPQSMEIVDRLLKMKVKSTMFQFKVETVTQLVRQSPLYLNRALQVFLSRERPNNMGKDVDNIKILQHIFRATRSSGALTATVGSGSTDDQFYRSPLPHPGVQASRELAKVIRDLANTAEVAPVLKTIVRKTMKQLTFEQVDIKSLCVGILENETHWESLRSLSTQALVEHMGLLSGIVWLTLLMRGAAVKSLQIQYSNLGRQTGQSGASGKIGAPQSIPRRIHAANLSKINKLPSRDSIGRSKLGKAPTTPHGHPNATSGVSSATTATSLTASQMHQGTATSGAANDPSSIANAPRASSTISVAVKAKEELQQTLALVQHQSIRCCIQLFQSLPQEAFPVDARRLYDVIIRKLLFLEIPPDVQATEHDKTCFASTREEIPIQEDTLTELANFFVHCDFLDRLESLRILESMVFRAVEGHLRREALWNDHLSDLDSYKANGGMLGLEVKDATFVQLLLELTQYKEIQDKERKICFGSRFWIACTMLLVVACFNPRTIGYFLWCHVPTLRSMMQMIITGRFSFPALNVPDSHLFGTFASGKATATELLQANAQVREYEFQTLQQMNNNDDMLMLFDPEGIARQPPINIVDHLQALESRYKLGVRLRQSREPDFLMEMVAENRAWSDANINSNNARVINGEQAWWIAEIVCEESETLQYLPHECVCQLVFLAHSASDPEEDDPSEEETVDPQPLADESKPKKKSSLRMLRNIIPRLYDRLREYLKDKEDNDNASAIVLFFMERLVVGESETRKCASEILHALTSGITDSSLDTNTTKQPSDMEVDSSNDCVSSSEPPSLQPNALVSSSQVHRNNASEQQMNFSWLPLVVKLPCYSRIQGRILSLLESVLERESSLASLKMCIQSLYEYWKQNTRDLSFLSNEEESTIEESLERTLMLANAFGKFLSGRKFLGKLLVEDAEVFAMLLDVFWVSIEAQCAFHLSGTFFTRVTTSDRRVFYVIDSSNNVQEVKLPLCVIEGVIHLLGSDLAAHSLNNGDGVTTTTSNSQPSVLNQLLLRLFPSKKLANKHGVISATGLLATKERKLCPDFLLERLACSANNHLSESASRALSPNQLWKLLSKYGLPLRSVALFAENLEEAIRSDELVVREALKQVSGSSGSFLRAQLGAYEAELCTQQTEKQSEWGSRGIENIRRLIQWFEQNCDQENPKAAQQADTLCEELESGFSFVKQFVKSSSMSNQSVLQEQEDLSELTAKYLNQEATGPDSKVLEAVSLAHPELGLSVDQQFLLRFSDDKFSRVIRSAWKHGESTDAKGAQSCCLAMGKLHLEDGHSGEAILPWRLRVMLLKSLSFCCNSPSGAIALSNQLTQFVHVGVAQQSTTKVQQTWRFIGKLLLQVWNRFDYDALIAFIRHFACSMYTFVTQCKGQTSSRVGMHNIHVILRVWINFVHSCMDKWQIQGVGLHLDPLTIRNVVTTMRFADLLDRIKAGQEATKVVSSKCKSANRTINNTHLGLALKTVSGNPLHQLMHWYECALDFTAAFSLVSEQSQMATLQELQQNLISNLYFQNPIVSTRHFQVFFPSWQLFVHVKDAWMYTQELKESCQLVTILDEIVVALSQDTNANLVDRFRELAIRYPLIALSRLLKRLLKIKGKISLTQLYFNAECFKNMVDAMEILQQVAFRQAELGVFWDFVFDLLEMISMHQAEEFVQLVARIFKMLDGFFRMEQTSKRARTIECLEEADDDDILAKPNSLRATIVDTVLSLYEISPQQVPFVVEAIQCARGGKSDPLRAKMSRNENSPYQMKTSGGRDSHKAMKRELFTNDQIKVQRVLAQMATTPQETPGNNQLEEALQMVQQICTQHQMGAMFQDFINCFVVLLHHEAKLTSTLMHSLCQTLLMAMRFDSMTIHTICNEYITATSQMQQTATKEAALVHAVDFLSFCDLQQTPRLLRVLMDDNSSKVVKAKVATFCNSPSFELITWSSSRPALHGNKLVTLLTMGNTRSRNNSNTNSNSNGNNSGNGSSNSGGGILELKQEATPPRKSTREERSNA